MSGKNTQAVKNSYEHFLTMSTTIIFRGQLIQKIEYKDFYTNWLLNDTYHAS